ncbi:MAG: metallopeptidase TldD-related protein [Anaerolineales bacterium]|jgi:predicted Zn-dependent protease
MQEQIIQTLHNLRAYALGKSFEVELFYHEEDSYLMRFANSAISLNTNEHLIRLDITAYSGRKRAGCSLITNLDKIDEIKNGIDTAAGMAEHAQPLNYQPTFPSFVESFVDESGYDPALATMSSAEKLAYFNQAIKGLEIGEIRSSGIFSSGVNTIAQVTTRSEHIQVFKTTDAQVSIVLSHARLKWEVTAEQSAQNKTDLDPISLQQELAFLLEHYQNDTPKQIPLGRYAIVFGSAAIAEMLKFMNMIAYDGGLMKRGFSFLTEDQVGKKVFSEHFTLIDDPDKRETYPFKRDLSGLIRKPWPIIEKGIFRGFLWSQDDADEFGARPTGHTVPHKSLVLCSGNKEVGSLQELVSLPRQQDLLYIPFLHYMNIVNPSKGIITASSRFGTLLLKKNGSVVVLYNVRLTQSLLDIFGDKVAWVSKPMLPYNTSESYGARNPSAILVPRFLQVNGLEISHSNSSY